MNATIHEQKRQQDFDRQNMKSHQQWTMSFVDKFAHLQGELNEANSSLAIVMAVFRTAPNAATTRRRSHAEVDGQPGDISPGGRRWAFMLSRVPYRYLYRVVCTSSSRRCRAFVLSRGPSGRLQRQPFSHFGKKANSPRPSGRRRRPRAFA
jgi:hypothetical protein